MLIRHGQVWTVRIRRSEGQGVGRFAWGAASAVEITLPVAIVAAAYIIGQAIGRVFNMVDLLQ